MWQVCAVIVAVLPSLVMCLYEDQVGSYDWHNRYVGGVSYISLDPSGKSVRGVVVASEMGVLAVLDPHHGDIRWRQLFEPSSNGYIDAVLRNKYGSLLTVSRQGQLVRSWDTTSGHLRYETLTSLPPPLHANPTPLHHTWRVGGVHAALAGKKGGVAVVGSRKTVVGLVTRSGEQKWRVPLETEESVLCGVYGQRDGVYLVSAVDSDEMLVTHLNSSNGAILASHHFSAPWIRKDTVHCLLSEDRLWCLDSADLQLYSALLTEATPTLLSHPLQRILPPDMPTPITLAPSPSPNEEVWLKAGQRHWLVGMDSGEIMVKSSLEVGVALASEVGGAGEEDVWDARVVQDQEGNIRLDARGPNGKKVGGVYPRAVDRGKPVLASIQLLTSSGQSVDANVVMVMEDDSIIMFGSREWSREDGLGTVNMAQFLDLPADQSAMVENFLERTKNELNPVKLALQRWQLQAQLFKEFIESVQEGSIATLLSVDSTELVRDQFNTRKMIVAFTARGKVYGLDSGNGEVVWQRFLPWLHPLKEGSPLLYILRSTSHPLHPPLAVIIGRSRHPTCYGAALVAFNPLTGEGQVKEPTLCLGDVLQTFLLAKEDRSHSKILLMLTREMEVVSYPSSVEVFKHLNDLDEQLFFYVVKKETGEIDGYYVNSPSSDLKTFQTSHLWHMSFPEDTERIISVVAKPANEHVSAMGRSRLDRSIQYKYLNPNLVAVVTESTDPVRPAVSVYLVDVVTGSVVFHTTHKAAVSPLHLVHSENWIVYQFLNSKLRRHELVVVELFERDSNHTRTVWSSLTPPPPPQILTQAYAVPTSFLTMTTTQTKRGITAKSILAGLKSGHLAAIPKIFLDPRREVEATDEMKEVGLPPYKPELLFTPQHYLNYNQTVARLRDIYSTPSGLESTSLVLAAGLDLYFTRVLPSKQFDLLAVDFDYYLITAVLVGMLLATVILSKMAARKSLNLLWK